MPYFCLVSKFYCSTPSISIPNTRSYMESLEMASQKNWEERSWTGIEGRHKICSFWYWYCVCINFREYTEVGPSPQKETMKTLMFKCFLTTCVSIRVFFFFHFLFFPPIVILPSVELYPCCIFIRPDLELPIQTRLLWKSVSLYWRQQDLAQSVTF